MAENR